MKKFGERTNKESIYGYENIIWGNTTFTVAEFCKQFPDCNYSTVTHLDAEVEREDDYFCNGKIIQGEITNVYRKKGAISTSMGLLTVFNK